jgi:hypothetical protein
MHVCAGDQAKRNAFLPESILQMLHRRSDLRTSIVIQSWQDMRRAHNDRHAVSYRCLRHAQRDAKVRSAIIDPRQNVAMQVNHSVSV